VFSIQDVWVQEIPDKEMRAHHRAHHDVYRLCAGLRELNTTLGRYDLQSLKKK